MLSRCYKKINSNLGFTLIEIILVAAIISLLTAIVIGNISSTQKRARDAKRISELRDFRYALELCYGKLNSYNIHSDSIAPQCSKMQLDSTNFINSWNSKCGEFGNIPIDPGNGTYGLHTTNDYQHYIVMANMESAEYQMSSTEFLDVMDKTGITFQWGAGCAGNSYNYAEGE